METAGGIQFPVAVFVFKFSFFSLFKFSFVYMAKDSFSLSAEVRLQRMCENIAWLTAHYKKRLNVALKARASLSGELGDSLRPVADMEVLLLQDILSSFKEL